MPMPKPSKPEDLNIGANGLTNLEGRPAKSLDVKVVKPYKVGVEDGIPDIARRMVELATKNKEKG